MVSPGEIPGTGLGRIGAAADGEEAGSLRRRPISDPIAPMRSPGSAGEEDRPQVAHCVTQGMIMNEETNRLIGIGKGTYNKLVKGGWVVDESIGVISPPSKQKKRD
uniref:Uncharacterized protein n=1 Tax=Chloropicon laureae TaxID=464258 RepID=A0A7S3E1Z4_9CHLO